MYRVELQRSVFVDKDTLYKISFQVFKIILFSFGVYNKLYEIYFTVVLLKVTLIYFQKTNLFSPQITGILQDIFIFF